MYISFHRKLSVTVVVYVKALIFLTNGTNKNARNDKIRQGK